MKLNHQGNANQNYIEILTHLGQNVNHKENKTINVGVDSGDRNSQMSKAMETTPAAMLLLDINIRRNQSQHTTEISAHPCLL
jgi:hypothetical protein